MWVLLLRENFLLEFIREFNFNDGKHRFIENFSQLYIGIFLKPIFTHFQLRDQVLLEQSRHLVSF